VTTPWRKTLRDLAQERIRTVLVVAAIAVGIVAFTAVLSVYAVLTREIDKGYLATDPASAVLHTDAIDDALVTAVLADHDVSAAEPRRNLNASIKTGPVQWRTLVLFVIKDYGNIRVSRLVPEQGAWPPAAGDVLIERDAFQVAHAKIGDTVTIRIGRGEEQTLRVTGSVHDVGQPQARMENAVYGYVTQETLARLGEQPYFDQLNILVASNRLDEGHIRSVAADVKKLVEGRGYPVRAVEIPQPGKHPHNDLMGVLFLTMAAFGLLVLALSGILVVNLLMAVMAAQVRQIGVMKAVGGTRGQVARIYLGQALLLGLAATLVAVPLGMLASRVLGRSFAKLLNFDITSFAVPLWVYALVLAVGIAVPLFSAAWPIWKGSAISVREALAAYGVSGAAFGTGAFDRVVAGIGGVFRPLLLAVRNSFRRRTRLALTVLALAASGVFFLSALNIRTSMTATLDRIFGARKYDLELYLEDIYPADQVERAVRTTPGVVRAESWLTSGATIPGSGSGSGSLDGLHFLLTALPANSSMIELQIAQGRYLLPGDRDAIVISSALAAKSRLKPGDTVALRIGPDLTSWHVVGISREGFFSTTGYIPRGFAVESGLRMRADVLLALEKKDGASIYAIRAALDDNLQREGIRVSGSRAQIDFRSAVDQHILMIYVFLVVMSGLILAVGGLGLATTMSLNVMERRREIGILRVLGASPSVVMLIVAAEAAVIGVMSWILSALAAAPLSRLLGNSLMAMLFKSEMDFVFALRGLWIWLAVAVVVSAFASLLPARSAARLTVRESLAYE